VPWDKPVHDYVMGDRCNPAPPGTFWRPPDNWPPPTTPVKFYLHADGGLRTAPPHQADAKLSYRYDPNDPAPTIGGQNLHGTYGPLDQRPVESRSDVLLFTSEPLSEPLEVTGRIYAELYVSSDCPDTDFTVKMTDVYPDGRSIILCDGILRARYHESLERPSLLTAGKVYKLRIDLWSTSVVFNRGHRIRVAVSSSNFPRFEPNPNTGKLPREGSETRVATNTVYLSGQQPSHIILPVDPRQGRP
jgi:putative CocE/NonD family hydrolase